jgi:hypothetical protein
VWAVAQNAAMLLKKGASAAGGFEHTLHTHVQVLLVAHLGAGPSFWALGSETIVKYFTKFLHEKMRLANILADVSRLPIRAGLPLPDN